MRDTDDSGFSAIPKAAFAEMLQQFADYHDRKEQRRCERREKVLNAAGSVRTDEDFYTWAREWRKEVPHYIDDKMTDLLREDREFADLNYWDRAEGWFRFNPPFCLVNEPALHAQRVAKRAEQFADPIYVAGQIEMAEFYRKVGGGEHAAEIYYTFVPRSKWPGAKRSAASGRGETLPEEQTQQLIARIIKGPSDGEMWTLSSKSSKRWLGSLLQEFCSLDEDSARMTLAAWEKQKLFKTTEYTRNRTKAQGITLNEPHPATLRITRKMSENVEDSEDEEVE